jgi:hypothetical protein
MRGPQKLDFSQGAAEQELQVEKQIMRLHGDVTSELGKAKPFVFGVNKA